MYFQGPFKLLPPVSRKRNHFPTLNILPSFPSQIANHSSAPRKSPLTIFPVNHLTSSPSPAHPPLTPRFRPLLTFSCAPWSASHQYRTNGNIGWVASWKLGEKIAQLLYNLLFEKKTDVNMRASFLKENKLCQQFTYMKYASMSGFQVIQSMIEIKQHCDYNQSFKKN